MLILLRQDLDKDGERILWSVNYHWENPPMERDEDEAEDWLELFPQYDLPKAS